MQCLFTGFASIAARLVRDPFSELTPHWGPQLSIIVTFSWRVFTSPSRLTLNTESLPNFHLVSVERHTVSNGFPLAQNIGEIRVFLSHFLLPELFTRDWLTYNLYFCLTTLRSFGCSVDSLSAFSSSEISLPFSL